MSSVLLSLGILAISFVLFRAALECASSIRILARHSRFNTYFFVAIASLISTVIVELVVAVVASSAGIPQFALGSALGVNAALIGVVIPLAVLTLGKSISIERSVFSRQSLVLMTASIMVPFFLLYDGIVTRLDGLVMILLFFFLYALYIFGRRYAHEYGITHVLHHDQGRMGQRERLFVWLTLVLSLIVLLVGGVFLVQSAVLLGELLRVPHYLLAFFIIGPAIALPGLVIGIIGAGERKLTVLFGDVIGSVVTNATFTVGISALIVPFSVGTAAPFFSWSFVGVAILGISFIFVAYTRRKIVPLEALLLLTLYAGLFFIMSYI